MEPVMELNIKTNDQLYKRLSWVDSNVYTTDRVTVESETHLMKEDDPMADPKNLDPKEVKQPTTPQPVEPPKISRLAQLHKEVSQTGRGSSGESTMGQFKDVLIQLLVEHKSDCIKNGVDGKVTAIPAGAIVRYFLNYTTVFNHLDKDDRYNRVTRYLSSSTKEMKRIGFVISETKPKMVMYDAKLAA